jgi:hypothetical protein
LPGAPYGKAPTGWIATYGPLLATGRKADEETIAAFGCDDRSLPLKCRIWNRRMANDADGLVAMSDSPCREVKLGARKDGLRVYVHRV